MTDPARIVVDTNVLVSRLLAPRSVPAQALRHATHIGRLLVSDETMREVADVLSRPKFSPYLSEEQTREFLQLLESVAELVPVTRQVKVCRDPKDDKFLALAVGGEADCIVTGDSDLLSLGMFEGVVIVTPATFLDAEALREQKLAWMREKIEESRNDPRPPVPAEEVCDRLEKKYRDQSNENK